MLNDIINDLGYAAALLAFPILLIATYRAFGIGRALMRGVYRNRAYWIGAVAVDLVFFVAAADFLPSNSPLAIPAFLLTFVVLIVFIDTSIRVAREADFFHRSILGWERVRKPFGVLLFASSALSFGTILAVGLNSYTTTAVGLLGVLQLFAVAALIFSWGAAALTIGARRSADKTLRRFAKMLGLTVVGFVLFLTVWIPFIPFGATAEDLGSTISEFCFVVGCYFLYLAVMSLSPVGRVEKEVSAASEAHGSAAT